MAGITPSRGIPLIRINSGTLASLAVNGVLDLNIVARNQAGPIKDRIPPRLIKATLRGSIEDIVFYVVGSSTQPHATISFWANDQHNTTNLANVHLLGQEDLTQGDFAREGTGTTTNIWRAYVGGLDIPSYDEDQTGEFHVTIENNQTAGTWGAGKTRLEFGYRPEFGA